MFTLYSWVWLECSVVTLSFTRLVKCRNLSIHPLMQFVMINRCWFKLNCVVMNMSGFIIVFVVGVASRHNYHLVKNLHKFCHLIEETIKRSHWVNVSSVIFFKSFHFVLLFLIFFHNELLTLSSGCAVVVINFLLPTYLVPYPAYCLVDGGEAQFNLLHFLLACSLCSGAVAEQ